MNMSSSAIDDPLVEKTFFKIKLIFSSFFYGHTTADIIHQLNVDERICRALLYEINANLSNPPLLNDVKGLTDAKQALIQAMDTLSNNDGGTKMQSLLLCGAPGAGKTMLARAIGAKTKLPFIRISACSLISKWSPTGNGDGLNIDILFRLTSIVRPCVLFLDDIDVILCNKNESQSEKTNGANADFICQLNLHGSKKKILVIAASSRPYDIDEALLRTCFTKCILIDLPDTEQIRHEILRSELAKTDAVRGMTDGETRTIAEITAGYSLADLTILVRNAVMMPIRRLIAEYGNTVFDRQRDGIESGQLLRPFEFDDLKAALALTKPSIQSDQAERIRQFCRAEIKENE